MTERFWVKVTNSRGLLEHCADVIKGFSNRSRNIRHGYEHGDYQELERSTHKELQTTWGHIEATLQELEDIARYDADEHRKGLYSNHIQMLHRRVQSIKQYWMITEASVRNLHQTKSYELGRIEEGEASTSMSVPEQLVSRVAISDRRQKVAQTLNNNLERSMAIARIENDMVEVGEVFQQVGDLVASQDAQVQHLEESVVKSTDETVKAGGQLQRAVTSARRARSTRKWVVCVGMLVAVLTVGGIVAGVYVAIRKT